MTRRSQKYQDDGYEKPRRRQSSKCKSKVHKIDGFDLAKFTPLTLNQNHMLEDFDEGYNVLATGSAGTGKTLCALYLALQKFITNGIEKIIIVRSAIPIRNQGFLPGTLEEKEEIYSAPYKSLVNNLFHNDTAWEILTKRGYIQFITTSYIRGLTFENCVVIFDELQNTDVDECYTLLTRLGKDSRIIICGDFKQDDIKRKRENSSFNWLVKLVRLVPEYFRIVEFTHDDIVRSDFVKKIIIASEKIDESF